jgi:ABC-type multidrug transport system fused ATPase/permease subunit
VLAAGSTALGLLPPLYQRRIVDDVAVPRNIEPLLGLVLALAGIYAGTRLVNMAAMYVRHLLGARFIRDLRVNLYAHLQTLALDYFNRRQTGEIMSRVTNDVEVLEEFITHAVPFLIIALMQALGATAILMTMDAGLTLYALIPVPFIALGLRFFNARARPIYRQARERLGDINARLADNIGGIRVIQAFVQEAAENVRFARDSQALYEMRQKSILYFSVFFPTMGLLSSVGMVLITYFGASKVVTAELTLGTLLAFVAYLPNFYQPLSRLTEIDNTIQRALAAGARVIEILDTEPGIADPPNGLAVDRLSGDIRFEDVAFAYENETVLHDVNLAIAPGEIVALVGRSGAGKTSLANLLLRFWDPQEGRILVDGHDLRDLSLDSLRSQIGVVLQDTFLFDGSIRDNLHYGRPDATDEEMVEAAKAAFAHEFISRLPKRYETQIGERGVKLSGGEKQRLALARAILVDPRILILDEATSSVDAEAEFLIQQALDNVMRGRTSLVIAHRLSTIRNADKIVAVESGRIVEIGQHDELINRGGLYSQLYRRQAELFEAGQSE